MDLPLTELLISSKTRCESDVWSLADGYDAYNKGLNLASGDLIGFINSDDLYQSDHIISGVVQVFSTEDIDACHADLVYVDPMI